MSVVLALRIPDAILIAADSRLCFNADRIHDDAPKILTANRHVFAAAGFVLLDDGTDVFGIARDLMEAADRSTTVTELSEAFEFAIAPHLVATLDRAYVRPPQTDRETQYVPGVQVMFANAAAGHPALAWRGIGGLGSGATGITRLEVSQRFDWPRPNPNILLIAGNLNPKRVTPAHLAYKTVAQAQVAADSLIAIATADHPTVGGPVDQIAIEPSGVRWLRRKAAKAYGWANVPEPHRPKGLQP
jgi:hypothetical protein